MTCPNSTYSYGSPLYRILRAMGRKWNMSWGTEKTPGLKNDGKRRRSCFMHDSVDSDQFSLSLFFTIYGVCGGVQMEIVPNSLFPLFFFWQASLNNKYTLLYLDSYSDVASSMPEHMKLILKVPCNN